MANIDLLKAAVAARQVPEASMRFAQDLLTAYAKWGKLSEKQDYWAGKLAQPVAPADKYDVARIFKMFTDARAHLKRPIVRIFSDQLKSPFTIRPAAANSANAGWLYVFEGTGEGKEYAGKLSPNGEFSVGRGYGHGSELKGTLSDFAADPVGKAKAYGKMFGSCCFCGRDLTDAVSIHLGFGPVCATRFGLAHKAAGRDVDGVMTDGGKVRPAVVEDEFNDSVPF